MTAAVLSIGTELTRGELINSNAAWLSAQLTTLGIDVRRHLTVADERQTIADALDLLARDVKVVIATGGLGPTTDDLTAAAAASALGVDLERDPAVLEHLKQRYAARGRQMLPANEKQADFPRGATVLPNPVGSAPGFSVALNGSRLFFLPGVPAEMKAIFRESVRPAVGELGSRDSSQLHVRVFGLPESEVQTRLEDVEREHAGVTLGYRAHFPEIEVKVHARAESGAAAETLARAVQKLVCERLGEAVYGDRDDTFAAVVGQALRAKKLSLAVAESCTGGMIGSMLTDVPGSSDYLLLDAVTYANSAKTQVLGVATDVLRAYGAVSAETAAAMAEGARRVSGSDVAVATTGIAGPGGGTDEKPVGTVWIGFASADGTLAMRHQLSGDRDQVRTRSAYVALECVRRHALGRAVNEGPSASTCAETRTSF